MTKLTFYGATEGMTGSTCLLETISSCVLLERGPLQNSRYGETITFRSKNSRQQGDI
jgi:hypothetical protein